MEAGSVPEPHVDAIVTLARALGENTAQVAALAGEISGAKEQLQNGSRRMEAIERKLVDVDDNQRGMDRRINGRVGKLESAVSSILARLGVVERNTLFNRLLVRLAHHPWVGTAASTAIGIAVTYLLTS